jgi:3'5'-cyclic nucleotide phosphodiesterase family protein
VFIGLFLLSTLLQSPSTKKNAQAPLSSLYDHNSPLEQLHYTLLLHILRRQGFGFLLDSLHSAPHFRKLLAETVLATDMRVHSQFMERFQQIVNGAEADHWTKRVLVCQALIKAADISNPVIKFSCVGYLPRLSDHSVSPDQCLTTLGICSPGGVDVTSNSRATPSHDPIGEGRS